jgi:lysophospholipid acyltransferase (LPLAT)-like uncharacterized protein
MSRSPMLDALLLNAAPPLTALFTRILMGTCRVVEVKGEENDLEALSRSGGAAVYVSWHQRIGYFVQYFRSRKISILISGSRDGEFGAKTAALLGFESVRGSSSHGGSRALRETIRRIRAGGRIGFLADGPQGPPRVAKLGPVLVARDGQAPVIPVIWGADRAWVFNSWDRFIMPKPFARIAVCFGSPIWIPRRTAMAEMETYRELLEKSLNEGASWCDTRFGAERPWRKASHEAVPEVGPWVDPPQG